MSVNERKSFQVKGDDDEKSFSHAYDETDRGIAVASPDLEKNMPRSATFGLPDPATFGVNEQEKADRDRRSPHRCQLRAHPRGYPFHWRSPRGQRLGEKNLDPRPRIATEFRTLSVQVSQGSLEDATDNSKKAAPKGLAHLQWHLNTIEEVTQRLGTNPNIGLEKAQIERRRKQDGPNVLSKPSNRWPQKIFGYVFGGFGSLLLGASIILFVSWKPLGERNPQASVLALAIVLFLVLVLQALFNAWQDFTTTRTMASITSMLPSFALVIRDGQRQSVPADALVKGDVCIVGMGQRIAADMRFIALDGEVKIRSVHAHRRVGSHQVLS